MTSSRPSLLHRTRNLRSNSMCKDFTPAKWSNYFENQEDVKIKDNVFHVYYSGQCGPVLFLIHGGGYSALTWSLFAKDIRDKIDCRIYAVDLRGHGCTTTSNEGDLSLEILVEDVVEIINILFKKSDEPIVLIGHSLGGAIAVGVAARIPSAVGLCVIDVVEGAAMEALSSMQNILRGRPKGFLNIEQAVQWSYRVGQTYNLEAAKVSMPGQIRNIQTGELASDELNSISYKQGNANTSNHFSSEAIQEENLTLEPVQEEVHTSSRDSAIFQTNRYEWRIDLSKTEQYWNGWFKDLSTKFLKLQLPKVLLLANIHGLDTTLTVGQMQGKFQLQILTRSGHAIHEDQPNRVADIIAGFLVKQKISNLRNTFASSVIPTG